MKQVNFRVRSQLTLVSAALIGSLGLGCSGQPTRSSAFDLSQAETLERKIFKLDKKTHSYKQQAQAARPGIAAELYAQADKSLARANNLVDHVNALLWDEVSGMSAAQLEAERAMLLRQSATMRKQSTEAHQQGNRQLGNSMNWAAANREHRIEAIDARLEQLTRQ